MEHNFDRIFKNQAKNIFFIIGPCVIESYDSTYKLASFLKDISLDLKIPFIFKASYDKANRTSLDSFRGPGIKKGIEILKRIRKKLNIPVMSDIHTINEVKIVSKVLDIIQIPAFLCRQTDLLLEAAKTGKPINIKKGQFLAPWDVLNIIKKISSTNNFKIFLTERGSTFGYNNLVVDFRSIKIMKSTGYPVIFDATHSVQLPGGFGKKASGQREFIPILAKAAVAAGVDGVFLEVHKNPDEALCDGPNSLNLELLPKLIKQLKLIKNSIT